MMGYFCSKLLTLSKITFASIMQCNAIVNPVVCYRRLSGWELYARESWAKGGVVER